MKFFDLKSSIFEMAAMQHNDRFSQVDEVWFHDDKRFPTKYIYGILNGTKHKDFYYENGRPHDWRDPKQRAKMKPISDVIKWLTSRGFQKVTSGQKTGKKSTYATGTKEEGTVDHYTGKAYHGTEDILFFRHFGSHGGFGEGSHLHSLNNRDAFSITPDFNIAMSFAKNSGSNVQPGMIVEFDIKNMSTYYATREEDDADEIEFPKGTNAVAIPHGKYEEKELAVIDKNWHKFMKPVAVHMKIPGTEKWKRYHISENVGGEELETFLDDYLVDIFGKDFSKVLSEFWYGREKYDFTSGSVSAIIIGRLVVDLLHGKKPFFTIIEERGHGYSYNTMKGRKQYYSAKEYFTDPKRRKATKEDQVEDEEDDDDYDEATTGQPAGVPTKSLSKVYHVGSLNPKDKGNRGTSLEGDGLSISLHPEDWKHIAKLGGNPTWELTKPGGKFLNAHSLSKKKENEILKWAASKGHLQKSTVYRVWFTDYDEDEDVERKVYFIFHDKAKAEGELEDHENDDNARIEEIDGYRPTSKIKNAPHDIEPIEVVLPIWVDQETDLDGVWWADRLDPSALSAPRGVISLSKLDSWKKKELGKDVSESSKVYAMIGTCVHGLDDPQFQSRIASDATEMEQLLDRADDITLEKFISMAHLDAPLLNKVKKNAKNYEAYFVKDDDILVLYDIDKDVHYFFVS